MAAASGAKRWLFHLYDIDLACLRHVQSAHGLMSQADALRLSLVRQAARSAAPGANRRYRRLAAAVSDAGQKANARRAAGGGLGRMPRCCQLLRDMDRAALAAIQEAHGLAKRAEAARLALRAQAVVDGLTDAALFGAA